MAPKKVSKKQVSSSLFNNNNNNNNYSNNNFANWSVREKFSPWQNDLFLNAV